jgi:hypothetical protein
MHRQFGLISPIISLVGLYVLLSSLYQPRLILRRIVNGATTSRYEMPAMSNIADRYPELFLSTGILVVGALGIYTDIYKPQQSSV